MNSKTLFSAAIAVFGLLIGLFIVNGVLTNQTNVIGQLYRYALPGSFLFGFIVPKGAMYALVLFAGYLDLLKKILVMGDNLYFGDLFFILGMPPVMLLGACSSITARILLSPEMRGASKGRHLKLLGITFLVVTIASILSVATTGFSLGVLKVVANSAAYFGLILAIPVLFPSKREMLNYLKVTMIIMVPAAIHAFWHFRFGLFDYEIDYLLSGFSSSIGDYLRGEDVFGPFSSTGALSGTMIICASLCLLSLFRPSRVSLEKMMFFSKPVAILLLVVFLCAAIISFKRMPIAVLPLALMCFFVIRSKMLTVMAYVGGVITFAGILLFNQQLIDFLPVLQRTANEISGNNEVLSNLLRIQTFKVRLDEFGALKDPDIWTPFGTKEKVLSVHSFLVDAVLKIGYVPLFVLSGLMIPCMIWFHRFCLRFKNSREARPAFLVCSIFISIYVVAFLGSGFIYAYPIPYFSALMLAIFVGLKVCPIDEEQLVREVEGSNEQAGEVPGAVVQLNPR